MYYSKVCYTGKYVPEKIVTNEEICTFIDSTDEWIYSRSGIKERHISMNENTSDLAYNAAKIVLERSGIKPEEIDAIICATCSPDYLTPTTACIVQSKIGAVNAFAFDLIAACSGFVYSVSTASKFITSGQYKNILVIGVENLSKATNWEDRTNCFIFADGAGAVLVTRSEKPQILAEALHSDGDRAMAVTLGGWPVSHRFNGIKPDMPGYIDMNGRAIFDFATRNMPKNINEVLEKAGLELEDIKHFVLHQANSRIVEQVARKLKLPIERFFINIQKYGNTSAATIPIALDEMVEKGLLVKGDKIILSGFGGGLTWGSVLLEW